MSLKWNNIELAKIGPILSFHKININESNRHNNWVTILLWYKRLNCLTNRAKKTKLKRYKKLANIRFKEICWTNLETSIKYLRLNDLTEKKKFTKKPFEIRQKVQGCQQTTRAFILIFFFYNFFFFQFCRSAQVVNKKELLKHRLLNRWTDLRFALTSMRQSFNPNNATETHSIVNLCKTFKEIPF